MIKFNNSDIIDWNFDDSNIIKVYHNGAVCYYKIDASSPSGQTPCFAVVDNISQYSDREFENVFNKADGKWYKLNNLNAYEEYGVYSSGRTITYYEGKLTIDDGYEYQYSGGSWVNVGEVSGATATLPNVPFVLNYNAKNYDATTHSIPMTTGQLNDTDAVAYNNPNNIVDHHEDGYITISSSSMRIRKVGQDISLFNRQSNSTSSNLTIVSKAKTENNGSFSVITNRDWNYNWMYRQYSGHLTLHGISETGQISCSSSNPDILSVRTYYDGSTYVKYNNWTQNTSTSPQSFSYGSTNDDSGAAGALFVGYAWNNVNEQWSGDFYWIYMAQANLTDDQVQQVIAYNESGGQSVYPVYYDEMQDPPDNVSFSSMTEAEDYECPWWGMTGIIDNINYLFCDSNEWLTKYSYIEVSGEYLCDKGNKYKKMQEYDRNIDGTMSATTNYVIGDLIESGSTDCPSCTINFCGVDANGNDYTINNGTTTLSNSWSRPYPVEGFVGAATEIIGDYCFGSIQSTLSALTIGNTVTTIQHEAFMETSLLTTLTIPSSVTQIDFWAFTRCYGLTEVIFEGTTPPTFTNEMGGVFHDYCPPVIYVPDSAVSAYRAIDGSVWTNQSWSTNIIQPISNR